MHTNKKVHTYTHTYIYTYIQVTEPNPIGLFTGI